LCGTQFFVLKNEHELQVSWKKEVTETLRLQKCEVSVQFTAVHNENVCDLWRSECDGEMKEDVVAGWWHKNCIQQCGLLENGKGK
jgi:hypothetical protein